MDHLSDSRIHEIEIGAQVRCIDGDYGVIKKIDQKDGMALVSWTNGQETWASEKNLRAV